MSFSYEMMISDSLMTYTLRTPSGNETRSVCRAFFPSAYVLSAARTISLPILPICAETVTACDCRLYS